MSQEVWKVQTPLVELRFRILLKKNICVYEKTGTVVGYLNAVH